MFFISSERSQQKIIFQADVISQFVTEADYQPLVVRCIKVGRRYLNSRTPKSYLILTSLLESKWSKNFCKKTLFYIQSRIMATVFFQILIILYCMDLDKCKLTWIFHLRTRLRISSAFVLMMCYSKFFSVSNRIFLCLFYSPNV